MTWMIPLGYLATVILAMRPIGKWWMNVPARIRPAYCHEYQGTRYEACNRFHPRECWRHDKGPRPRNTWTGFSIVILSALWPILAWPALALALTPKVTHEREQEAKQLREQLEAQEAEVNRLLEQIREVK